MKIQWDVSIVMDDNTTLKADIFMPDEVGQYPILMTYGPYGKGLAFQEGYAEAWNNLVKDHPNCFEGSSCKYMNWETVDPEYWTQQGYICIRVDSRGAGRSEGKIDVLSFRETQDYYQCIEWAAVQPWSNGNIGLLGISYYAVNQWNVAGLNPPHLKAICAWEGAGDWYRDQNYHGGIPSDWLEPWYETQVVKLQHGYGDRGYKNQITGELVSGPDTFSEEILKANRTDLMNEIRSRPLCDDWHSSHSAQWENIHLPMLSSANWGGQGVHLRGNIEAFTNAASLEKWLECHGLEHWTEFYTPYGVALQKKFFDYYLKGIKNGWGEMPKVQLKIRQVDDTYIERAENSWPLEDTEWTKYYLDTENTSLLSTKREAKSEISYEPLNQEITFLSNNFHQPTEITGPIAAKLFISSTTDEADLFLALRLFDPDMDEVFFIGANDPEVPLTVGWLRASHRKLDLNKSKPWKPYHTHDEIQPLKPNNIYEVNVEILPTCIQIPAGYSIGLTIRGTDFINPKTGETSEKIVHKHRLKNMQPSKITVYTGKDCDSYILLPIIQKQGE